MVSEEVEFKLLDFVQTSDGEIFSIGFLDSESKKTLSKKTAYSMYKKGQIIKATEAIQDRAVLEDLTHY